jgi:hypothetical protein
MPEDGILYGKLLNTYDVSEDRSAFIPGEAGRQAYEV